MSERTATGAGFRALLLIAAIVIVIAGLKAASALLLPILVAFFLAIVSIPFIAKLQGYGFPDWAAVTIVFMSVLVCFLGVSYVVGNSIQSFLSQLPVYQAELENKASGLIQFLQDRGMDVSTEKLTEQFDTGDIFSVFGGALRSLASTLSDTVFVMLTVVFVLGEAAIFPRKLRAMIGDPDADLANYTSVTDDLQIYLRVMTQVSLLTGVCVACGTYAVGLEYPIMWGLLAFLLNYIPNLGSFIAAIPAVALSLVSQSLWQTGIVIFIYVAVNMVIGNVLQPRMMGRRLGLSTLVVFLSMVFWGWVWGPIGMILSVPLTMVIRILLEHSDDMRWVAVLLGPAPDDAAASKTSKSS